MGRMSEMYLWQIQAKALLLLGCGQAPKSRNAAFFKFQIRFRSFKLVSKIVSKSSCKIAVKGKLHFSMRNSKNERISEVPRFQKSADRNCSSPLTAILQLDFETNLKLIGN